MAGTNGFPDQRVAQLIELCEDMFRTRKMILASNRGPVDYVVDAEGKLQAKRGSGGVVTALSALTKYVDFTWIASAMGEGDRRAAQASSDEVVPLSGQRVQTKFVVTPRRMYHRFYNVICNPLLWFLQHYMWNIPHSPNIDTAVYDAWEHGYVPVNLAFAREIAKEADRSGQQCYVMIHDYQLYLAPDYVRKLVPNAVISHFSHIPWPTSTYWQLLPKEMRTAIVKSLCSCDILGFQTQRDVRRFLHTCEDFLDGVHVDHDKQTMLFQGHNTQVRSYPISIDVAEVRRIATSTRAQEYERNIARLCNKHTIMRVDRSEPSKNILRGFRAFELLLERHPELRGEVNFIAFIVPSRTHISQYKRYQRDVEEIVERINAAYGTPDWQPITMFLENNYVQALAGMRLYDVLLVNPVIDGMNLVAKEGPVVNTKAGVLVLSETVGAQEQLAEGALSVAPADIFGTSKALYEALTMPQEERQRRSDILTEVIESADVIDWLTRQMMDLRNIVDLSPFEASALLRQPGVETTDLVH
ncbi:MAG: trehalose 6-phosphate synthase [Chloroflexi bacterium]|jgi:trehalose 6-phosphate synthase|nr:MAG: trehalose 6-phosphate synthase [Chloroflexota bacterium]